MALQPDPTPDRGSGPSSARSVPARAMPGVRLDGGQTVLLRVTRAVLRVVVKLSAVEGVQLEGLPNIPTAGPLLICSNHLSNLDPLVYAAILPRVLHALTKAELYRNPLLRGFLLRCNCIPVRREAPDRVAIHGALAVLGSGGALLLFPEGHRSLPGAMLEFEPGAGYLALRSGAQVVPCAIWGTEDVLPKRRLVPCRGGIAVRIGEPFRPAGGDPSVVSRGIRARVLELMPARYRGSADSD